MSDDAAEALEVLVAQTIEATRDLVDVNNVLTRRIIDARKLQHRLLEVGDEDLGRLAERVADTLDLMLGKISRIRKRLSVAATGTDEPTPPPMRLPSSSG